MKTRFLATMSHDIRTPLNGIIGMVNMGNQYADDPQMQQKIREKVMESLKYLVSLVNDVLDMNKLQSGDLKDQQLLFDLTEVLQELNQIYDERAAKKGIRYEIDWKSTYSHSALVGNPVYLGSILSNIMDNAIKFSQAGSVLMVGVKEEFLPLTVTRSKFLCVTDNSAANSLSFFFIPDGYSKRFVFKAPMV